ncbi:hypothetical protein ACOSQ3_029111 [Xanthoceras sorbifolium]
MRLLIELAREIICEKPSGFASCSCKKIESEGIPCRHFMTYFNLMQITFLPNQYILKKWTKVAKCDVIIDDKSTKIKNFVNLF